MDAQASVNGYRRNDSIYGMTGKRKFHPVKSWSRLLCNEKWELFTISRVLGHCHFLKFYHHEIIPKIFS